MLYSKRLKKLVLIILCALLCSCALTTSTAYAEESYFKVYVNDTGLLSAMYGFSMKAAIVEKTLNGTVKGAIYENLIAEELEKNGHVLFYYKKNEGEQEILFKRNKVFKVIKKEKIGNEYHIYMEEVNE